MKGLIIIWAGILLLNLFCGCAHVDMGQYKAAFTTCLTEKGLTDAGGIGGQAIGILDHGGQDANSIVASLENLLVGVAGMAALDVVVCAVKAWSAAHPVPAAGPQAKPTPSQVAARIFIARHTVPEPHPISTGAPAGARAHP